MKYPFLLMTILGALYGCKNPPVETNTSVSSNSVELDSTSRNPFEELDYFERNKKEFRMDTFSIEGKSTEGGELVVYHAAENDFLVFDFWLFGEMGKQHSTYLTDKKLDFNLVKIVVFKYDKPMFEPDYKESFTEEYILFEGGKAVAYFDAFKKEKDHPSEELKGKGNSAKEQFHELTKDIKIVK